MQHNLDARKPVSAKHRRKRATILIMGPSGSGKTSFTNLISGSTFPVASSSASPTTDRIQTTQEFAVDGYTVTVVDTPALNHNKMGADGLKSIKTFLANQYLRGELTTGIIYIHSIRDEEPPGALNALEEICGDEALQNVAIVTSKWDSDGSKHTRSRDRRERELVAGPFSNFNNKGVRVFRNDRGQQSALEILEYLVKKRPVMLQVQRKMVDESLLLQHTGTGHILLRDLSTDPTQDQLDMLRDPILGADVPNYEATQYGKRLQDTLHKSKRPRRETGREDKESQKWNFGEMVVCFCCGVALYAFMTVLKQRAWHGVDMIMI